MFTGIVKWLGTVVDVETRGTNKRLCIESELAGKLSVDQSINHNGVCLTVAKINDNHYWVDIVEESLARSNLGAIRKGDQVNLEQSLTLNDLLDGHIVQGHIDCTGTVQNIEVRDGSWLFSLGYPGQYRDLVVEKGSICVNGVSLTIVQCSDDRFSVTIIPYTFEHTNFRHLKAGDRVNLEFDILGKYVKKYLTTVRQ